MEFIKIEVFNSCACLWFFSFLQAAQAPVVNGIGVSGDGPQIDQAKEGPQKSNGEMMELDGGSTSLRPEEDKAKQSAYQLLQVLAQLVHAQLRWSKGPGPKLSFFK